MTGHIPLAAPPAALSWVEWVPAAVAVLGVVSVVGLALMNWLSEPDPIGRARRHRREVRAWRRATTVQDLAALTVRWLRGELHICATYGGPPDPETTAITPTLIAVNSAGVLTTTSQPGWTGRAIDGTEVEQRALVELVCPLHRLSALHAALWDVGILALDNPGPVEVIRGGKWDSTIRPGPDLWWPWVSRKARRALRECVILLAVDPEWGRVDSPLWHGLDAFARQEER